MIDRTLLTIPDVAELLQLSERTIRRMISAGEIHSALIQGKRRIRAKDLADYIASQFGDEPDPEPQPPQPVVVEMRVGKSGRRLKRPGDKLLI